LEQKCRPTQALRFASLAELPTTLRKHAARLVKWGTRNLNEEGGPQMSPSTAHDTAAKRIAKKLGVEYNRGKGPDVIASRAVVEVETAATVKDGLRQLQGFRRSVYIAGANQQAVNAALEATKGTTVGVMDEKGKIVKRSSRKKR